MTFDSCRIERLCGLDHERLKAVRLRALADAPAAFGTKFEDAVTWPLAEWRKQLERATTFVARGSLPSLARSMDVGVVRCVLHPEAHTASLISLWVAPEARRLGVASQLIEAVLTFAREREMSRIVLDVVETNTAAIALYRKHGFAPNGERAEAPDSWRNVAEIQLERLL